METNFKGLNEKERDFCLKINLKPSVYLTLRREIFLEYVKNKYIKEQTISKIAAKNKNSAPRPQI